MIMNCLAGKLIGAGGATIKHLKSTTKCLIQLREIDENGYFRSFTSFKQRQADKTVDKEGLQVCLIEGTRSCIDHCLELVRNKFPIDQYPDLTMDQINLPANTSKLPSPSSQFVDSQHHVAASGSSASTPVQPLQLGLAQGVMHEVYVSNIVSGGKRAAVSRSF